MLVACFMVASVFASGASDKAASDGTIPETGDITLTIYARAYTLTQDAPWKIAEEKIKAAHPGINFNFVYEGTNWDNLRTKFLTAAGAGDPPDVVMTDIIWLGEYADSGLIADVTEMAEAWSEWDDVAPLYKEATKWNGRIYGTWLNTDVRIMAYNKKLFREAGLDPEKAPTTWSEQLAVAKAISDKLGPGAYGLGFPATLEDETSQTFYAYLFSLGGKILSDDNKTALFNSEEGVEALSQLVELVNCGATPRSIVSGSSNDINQGVFQDKFAMSYMTKAYGYAVANIKDLTKEQYLEDFGVATIPRADDGKPATMCGGYLLCVPEGAKNKSLSWEFITYAAGAEAQFAYTTALGYVPTFTSLMDRAEDYYEVDPYFEVILDQLNNANFRPSIPQYTEVSAEIQHAIQAAVLGEKTPKAALDDAARIVNSILAE